MSRRRKYISKYVASDSERWRIALLAEYGFYASTIAKRIWGNGNPRYQPNDTEIARVYRIAKKEGVKLSDWRRGENRSAQKVLNGACRVSMAKHPNLRVVA